MEMLMSGGRLGHGVLGIVLIVLHPPSLRSAKPPHRLLSRAASGAWLPVIGRSTALRPSGAWAAASPVTGCATATRLAPLWCNSMLLPRLFLLPHLLPLHRKPRSSSTSGWTTLSWSLRPLAISWGFLAPRVSRLRRSPRLSVALACYPLPRRLLRLDGDPSFSPVSHRPTLRASYFQTFWSKSELETYWWRFSRSDGSLPDRPPQWASVWLSLEGIPLSLRSVHSIRQVVAGFATIVRYLGLDQWTRDHSSVLVEVLSRIGTRHPRSMVIRTRSGAFTVAVAVLPAPPMVAPSRLPTAVLPSGGGASPDVVDNPPVAAVTERGSRAVASHRPAVDCVADVATEAGSRQVASLHLSTQVLTRPQAPLPLLSDPHAASNHLRVLLPSSLWTLQLDHRDFPEVLARDRLLGSYKVKPVIKLLKQTLVGTGVLLVSAVSLFIFATPVEDLIISAFEPSGNTLEFPDSTIKKNLKKEELLSLPVEVKGDDDLAAAAAAAADGRPVYCRDRFYRALAGGQYCKWEDLLK